MGKFTTRYWTAAVTHYCEETRAASHVERQGFEFLLPYVEIVRGGRWRKDLMFPGYILVRVVRGWEVLSSTRGISRLLLCGARPSVIREDFIKLLRARTDERGIVQLHPRPRVGGRATVQTGAFAGATGLVSSIAGLRCSVLLSVMGRETVGEFDMRDLAA